VGERICTIDDCTSPVLARGWCSKHYCRWQAHGDPLHTERPLWHQPEDVRFWAKVDASGVCWEWTGWKTQHGYGNFPPSHRSQKQTRRLAHAWAWEYLIGPIPDGMQLDHRCGNTSCVNPDHLEVVTQQENIRRSHNPMAMNARKTHCPKGHPYDEENTRVYARPGSKYASRYCLACRQSSARVA
jgi:hypothetical protein